METGDYYIYGEPVDYDMITTTPSFHKKIQFDSLKSIPYKEILRRERLRKKLQEQFSSKKFFQNNKN